MAVVKEFIASSGVRVQIRDDCYRDLSRAERDARKQHFYETCARIRMQIAEREAEKHERDHGAA